MTAVTIFAILAIFVLKLDFGIDFKGGVRMEFSLQKEASVDQVREVVSDAGVFEPVVQSVGTPATGSAFMVTAQEMNQAQIDAVKATLASDYGLDAESTAVEQVGASFGKSTTNMAFIGVAIAILFIIGYLWFRFELKFAIPAILALIHDVGLTLGIYAASQRLVTSATVAAILTILGYSVHDTIIVYDRMRENTLLMKKETYGDMVDLSIRQTMVRSINTTVAILLPLLGHPDLRRSHPEGLRHGPHHRRVRGYLLIVLCGGASGHHLERAGAALQEASCAGDSERFGCGWRSACRALTGVTGVTPSAVSKAASGKPGQTARASGSAKAKSSKGRSAGNSGKRTSR